jgi:hypothetical protein
MTTTLSPTDFGAKCDGVTDDSDALHGAVMTALACNGAVLLPPGRLLITKPISFPEVAANLSIMGCGSNVSVIVARETQAFDFTFAQRGAQQPWGCQLSGFAIEAEGECPLAVSLSYGWPSVSNDHNQAPNLIRHVQVVSGIGGYWKEGLKIVGAWNMMLENVWLSGNSCDGDWSKLSGTGINLRGSCVNCHMSNCRANFWADGILVTTRPDGPNTEGLFVNNCSMVGVKRGITVVGNKNAPAPRMSTLTVVGGLIECRVGGVSVEEISAGIYLTDVWTCLVTGVQILTECLPPEGKVTYGILGIDSAGVVATACDINAVLHGFHIGGESRACACHGNTFTNVKEQVVLAPNTVQSRSYGNVQFNDPEFEWSWGGGNKMGFVN